MHIYVHVYIYIYERIYCINLPISPYIYRPPSIRYPSTTPPVASFTRRCHTIRSLPYGIPTLDPRRYPPTWPLHDIATTNIVWYVCDIRKGGGGGGRILRNSGCISIAIVWAMQVGGTILG